MALSSDLRATWIAGPRPGTAGAVPSPAVVFRRRRRPGATRASGPLLRAAAIAAALSACTSVVNGNGVLDTRTISAAPFSGVAVDNGIGANVAFGAPQSVVLSGDSNVIHDYITVTVESGVLRARISGVDRVTYGIPPVLEIKLPAAASFDYAEAHGHGYVNVFGAQASQITVDAQSSTVTLAGGGSSTTLTATVASGTLKAIQHVVDAAQVTATDSTVELTLKAPTGTVTGSASGTSAIEVCGGGAATCAAVQCSGSAACCVPLLPSDPACQP